MLDISAKLYRVTVSVRVKRQYAEHVEKIVWRGMSFQHMQRWEWYFRYREALLRVRYPRHYIEYGVYSYMPAGSESVNMDAHRLALAKRQLTKFRLKIADKREQWLRSDPMGLTRIEDTPNWLKVTERLEVLESNVNALQSVVDSQA